MMDEEKAQDIGKKITEAFQQAAVQSKPTPCTCGGFMMIVSCNAKAEVDLAGMEDSGKIKGGLKAKFTYVCNGCGKVVKA